MQTFQCCMYQQESLLLAYLIHCFDLLPVNDLQLNKLLQTKLAIKLYPI